MNKPVTIDLAHAALADVIADARASATASPPAHPQSLLDLPPGEARESLLTVHGILGTKLPPTNATSAAA